MCLTFFFPQKGIKKYERAEGFGAGKRIGEKLKNVQGWGEKGATGGVAENQRDAGEVGFWAGGCLLRGPHTDSDRNGREWG